jgi:hypothetical protein
MMNDQTGDALHDLPLLQQSRKETYDNQSSTKPEAVDRRQFVDKEFYLIKIRANAPGCPVRYVTRQAAGVHTVLVQEDDKTTR